VSSELIPRQDLVDALISEQTRVVLVAGPSGAGKSHVLREAVEVVRPHRTVAGPHEVMWSSPLPELMLDGLASIIAQIVESQSNAQRVGEQLSGAIERLVASKGRELAVAAGKELLGLIRARLGPEVGQALVDTVTSLREENAESLGSRLDRARSQTALELIVSFATEVVTMSVGRPALIVLDRCERLDDTASRLLADLAELLPDGLQLWVGVRDDSGPGPFLLRTDAGRVHIPPLNAPAIAELLVRRALPPSAADRILERTKGTALDVQASIGLLSRGESDDVDAPEALARDTAQRVATLSDDTRSIALRLAALSDPLPESYMLRFTGGDAIRLAVVMTELAEAGLLTAHGEKQWIHERRRESLLASASEDDIQAALADAATAVWEYVQAGGEHQWLVELANLAARSPQMIAESEDLAATLALDNPALGLIAALVELTEPSSPFVEGQALLSYARTNYPTDETELSHLESLGESGIVSIESTNRSASVALQLSPLSMAVAVGRVGRSFGHLPIPAISSAAFRNLILPRVGPLVDVHYGIGRPPLRTLSYMAMGVQEKAWSPSLATVRRDTRPALIVRAAFAGRPLYGVFRFESTDARDTALDALAGLDVEFLDDRLTVSSTVAFPMTAVPVERFLRAAGRVIGRVPRLTTQGIKEPLDAPIPYAKLVKRRVATARTLRKLAGATLRGAMELDLPLSLYWFEGDRTFLQVEVHGGREIAVVSPERPEGPFVAGPYRLFRLAQELGLQPGENITQVSGGAFAHADYAPNRFDPVLAEIGRRRTAAIAFNNAQRQLPIRFDDVLAASIRDAFLREMRDARAFAAELPILGRDDWEVPPIAKYVVLPDECREPQRVPGLHTALIWAEAESVTGSDECHVIYEMARPSPGEGRDGFRQVPEEALVGMPGYKQDAVQQSVMSSTRGGIASLLGYREEDLDFLPDASRA
jgi:AAA ATPase domain